jgi:hypothetical protein
MKRTALAIFLGSFFAVSAVQATTYVRVEPDGTKTYSDRPIPGGKEVELQSAQTYSAQPAQSSGTQGVPREQQLLAEMDNFRYDSCDLTPKNDETFMNPVSVRVGVLLKPLLRVGDIIDLKIDGTAIGGPATQSFTMQPAFRGTHTLSVQVKDRFGKPLCNSSVSFHVHQPNLNSPVRK